MKEKNLPLVALLSALLVAVALPLMVTNNYWIIVFNQTLISIIIVIGLNFITGLLGQMNLGTAGISAMGAYTSALLCTRLQLSPWLALVCSMLMGCLLGILLGYPSLRIKGIYLALTTIGFGEIVRIVINNLGFTGGSNGVRNIPSFFLFGRSLKTPRDYYFFLLTITVLLIWFALRVIHSKWGRAIKAIRDNEIAVEASGIRLSHIKVFAFTLCCVYGCIGGSLYAHLMGYISPSDFTLDSSIRYLMMLMVGGIGFVPGTILGAIIVNLLPEQLRFLGNYYWLIFSIIVLIFAIFVPKGLVSLIQTGIGKLRGARREGR